MLSMIGDRAIPVYTTIHEHKRLVLASKHYLYVVDDRGRAILGDNHTQTQMISPSLITLLVWCR